MQAMQYARETTFSSDDENKIYSYFCMHDELTDVVACPGIVFTSLQNSCYVNIDDIPDLDDED